MKWLIAICVMGFASNATAQPDYCVDTQQAVTNLTVKHQERVVGMGVTAIDHLAQLYVSKAGEWSILVIHPGNKACLLASGDGWQMVKPKSKGF